MRLIKTIKDTLNSAHSHANSAALRQSKKTTNQNIPNSDHSNSL